MYGQLHIIIYKKETLKQSKSQIMYYAFTDSHR